MSAICGTVGAADDATQWRSIYTAYVAPILAAECSAFHTTDYFAHIAAYMSADNRADKSAVCAA